MKGGFLYLLSLSIIAISAINGVASSSYQKAPYKVLYSNDVTHIVSCVSPYHKKGEGFTEEMLKASILETAGKGVDVHMLQPGLGWIPWWKSSVYPAADHYKAFIKRTGFQPDSFGRYMIEGGDMVQVFVDTCKKCGLVPFISLRLNDAHHLENAGLNNKGSIWVSQFYYRHPEYRIGKNHNLPDERVQNWAISEVRSHKLAFIQELCTKYDIEGLELDFMRHPSYFQLEKTTFKQRVQIMTGFVSKVRKMLDEKEKQGQHLWLSVRIPSHLEAYGPLGLSIKDLVAAGADMLNISGFYFTEQQDDIRLIREMAPKTAIYKEMAHCASIGPKLTESGYDNFAFRRATKEQLYTTAHLAYTKGADGVSLFNYAYYREHGVPGRGTFAEPPFDVIKQLRNLAWLSEQPQNYFIGNVWDMPHISKRQLPRKLNDGEQIGFDFDIVLPERKTSRNGVVRIHGANFRETKTWDVLFNGSRLEPTEKISEPYTPIPSETLIVRILPSTETLIVRILPSTLLQDGKNRLEIKRPDDKKLNKGTEPSIRFIDITVE